MQSSNDGGFPPCSNHSNHEQHSSDATLLEELNPYIVSQARQRAPRAFIPSELLDLEIHEIAQNTSCKLWQALCRGPIHNPKAYINAIIRTEVADVVRRYRRTTPLHYTDDGELHSGVQPLWQGEEQDPAEAFEQAETLSERLDQAITGMLLLPQRQREAMLIALRKAWKTQSVDLVPLLEKLTRAGFNIQALSPTMQPTERLRTNSSLHIARRKLKTLMEQVLHGNIKQHTTT